MVHYENLVHRGIEAVPDGILKSLKERLSAKDFATLEQRVNRGTLDYTEVVQIYTENYQLPDWELTEALLYVPDLDD